MSHHPSSQRGSPFGDYDPYYGGGGYYGRGDRASDFSLFMMDPNVKMYWVAFFSLLAYWGLVWFLRHVFGDGHYSSGVNTRTTEDGVAVPQNTDATGGYRGWIQRPGTSNAHNRLTRASQVLGDLILMLLSVLVLNTIGQSRTRIVMILTWVFFGFAVFWSIFEAAKESHVARFLFGMIFYGIVLAIGILSFTHGFHGFFD
ncbi:uncharacterized protein BX664DRAFT_369559 [Halteromyces radiatus]|uniref:uncharacterized protein n=1 Tax=Halteromyces radiatus TaxID=101107 RepID=UPI002220286B|nr:uncharacterized protein BX664DRAFT_369559 [Halteromyces radiatus]KAI8077881.1 hypothetical protein BX664DRAFT_369559 [Halteromyces radiatus]